MRRKEDEQMTNGIPDLFGDTAMGNKTSIMTNGATEEMPLELTATGKPKMVFDKDYNPVKEEGRHNLIQLAIVDSGIEVETPLQQAAVYYMKESAVGITEWGANRRNETHVKTAVRAFEGVRDVDFLLTDDQKANELIQNFLNSAMATYKHFNWDMQEEFEIVKNSEVQTCFANPELDGKYNHPMQNRALGFEDDTPASVGELVFGMLHYVDKQELNDIYSKRILENTVKEIYTRVGQQHIYEDKMKLATIYKACLYLAIPRGAYEQQLENVDYAKIEFYKRALWVNKELYEKKFKLGNTSYWALDYLYNKALLNIKYGNVNSGDGNYKAVPSNYEERKDYYEGHYKAMYFGE